MEEHKNNGCENLPLPEGEGKSEISEAPPTTPIQPLTKKPTKIRPRTTIRKKAKNEETSKPGEKEEDPVEAAPLPLEVQMWKEKIAFYEEQMNDTIEKAKGVIYNIQEPYIEEEMEELGKMFEVNLSKAIGNEDQIQYHISKLLAPLIDSIPLTLSELLLSLQVFLAKIWPKEIDPISPEKLKEQIIQIAERKAYGIKSKSADMYESETSSELWVWEITNLSLLEGTCKSTFNQGNSRTLRALFLQKLKTLLTLVSTIQKSKYQEDVIKIKEEVEKYEKVIRKEQAQRQKEIEKEIKLVQKEKQLRDKEVAKELARRKKEEEKSKKDEEKKKKDDEKKEKELERKKKIEEEKTSKKRKRQEEMVKAMESENEEVTGISRVKRPKIVQNSDETEVVLSENKSQNKITNFFIKSNVPESKTLIESNTEERKCFYTKLRCKLAKYERPRNLSNLEEFENNLRNNDSEKTELRLKNRVNRSFKKAHKVIKYIFIENSFSGFVGYWTKVPQFVCGKQPFMKEEIIDYEMDSEDEYAENNGEDIGSEREDREDETFGTAEDDSFVVPDRHLSDDELSSPRSAFGDETSFTPPVIDLAAHEKITEIIQIKPSIMFKFAEYQAHSLIDSGFPLNITKIKTIKQEEAEKNADKTSIEDCIPELVQIMHGSYYSIPTLIDQFRKLHPELSKTAVEKWMKKCAIKDKRQGDPKARWYIKEDTISRIDYEEFRRVKNSGEESKDRNSSGVIHNIFKCNGDESYQILTEKHKVTLAEKKKEKKMIIRQEREKIQEKDNEIIVGGSGSDEKDGSRMSDLSHEATSPKNNMNIRDIISKMTPKILSKEEENARTSAETQMDENSNSFNASRTKIITSKVKEGGNIFTKGRAALTPAKNKDKDKEKNQPSLFMHFSAKRNDKKDLDENIQKKSNFVFHLQLYSRRINHH